MNWSIRQEKVWYKFVCLYEKYLIEMKSIKILINIQNGSCMLKEMNEMKCENEIDFIHYLMRVEDRRTIYSDSIERCCTDLYVYSCDGTSF